MHIKGIFELDELLATAEKVDKAFYDEVNKATNNKSSANRKNQDLVQEEVYKHVQVAEEIMKQLEIRFCKENYYVWNNGVYKDNLPLIEHKMLNINNNLKKSERAEVLDHIRIKQWREDIDIDENYINFRNGMYDLKNNVLVPHDPEIFTTCQVNAEYIEDDKLEENQDIENFLDIIMCVKKDDNGTSTDDISANDSMSTSNDDISVNDNNNSSSIINDRSNVYENRKTALLQIIGYCMTFKVDLQKAFIFYGPTAKNGKSTLIEIINAVIGRDNICHITVHQLLKRFTIAELTNKLLNTETEIATDLITNMEVFKKIITGDEISVEKKYQDRHIIKPFAKFIFGTNDLPVIENTNDEGYFRRLNILLFERQFTREDELNFDKSKLLTPDALNYLANRALREYIKIIPTRTLANEAESEKLITEYRETSNTAKQFLEDDKTMGSIFMYDNKVLRTYFYQEYANWCAKYNLIVKKKKDFYKEVLKTPGYTTSKVNGEEVFVNLKEKTRREKDRERIIF